MGGQELMVGVIFEKSWDFFCGNLSNLDCGEATEIQEKIHISIYLCLYNI